MYGGGGNLWSKYSQTNPTNSIKEQTKLKPTRAEKNHKSETRKPT